MPFVSVKYTETSIYESLNIKKLLGKLRKRVGFPVSFLGFTNIYFKFVLYFNLFTLWRVIMKMFKKSTLSLALTAAMIGGVAMTQQATALPAGSAGATQAAVVAGEAYVNPNGLGQALIFPYYSVRGGLKSFFNITNTADYAVAVKVRFHEGHNSRDALDFNLVLSPQDVWAGWIEDSATGPVVKTNDNSCVVGAPNIRSTGQALSNVAYGDIIPAFQDQGDNSIERTREGYVEVIGMGRAYAGASGTPGTTAAAGLAYAPVAPAIGNTAYYATHDATGSPRDCGIVDANFVAPNTAPQTLPVAFPFVDTGTPQLGDGDPVAVTDFVAFAANDNPLKGNFSVINSGTGIGAGNAAIAIADFMDPAAATLAVNGNLITAQNFPYFLEPTLASRDGIWTTSGLASVEAAMTSNVIINEWANNPSTGAATDWIVTFPTKGFHVDNMSFDATDVDANPATTFLINTTVGVNQNIQASNNQWRAAYTPAPAPFQDNINASGAAVDIGIVGYNREELGVAATTGNTTPSPFPPGGVTALSLQGEANLISFSPTGTPSALGGENFVLNFDVSGTLAGTPPNGWAQLTFDPANANLPTIGYAYKSRNQGSAALSFGQILGHAWK